MITLKNGHKLDFVVSSGALGFYGKGYWFEQPFRWLGFIRPEEFTIITKTLTLDPRQGNLKWWCPWKSVKFIKNGVVNAVGLTNKGLKHWVNNYKVQYKTIVSIHPFTVNETIEMAHILDDVDIVGIELNLSCPNTHTCHAFHLVDTLVKSTKHPIIIKLGYDNYEDYIRNYAINDIAAFDLINSVPWKIIFPDKKPPIRNCSGVSGPIIKNYAREALIKAKILTNIPLISGGGVDSVEEVYARLVAGAGAVSFGTIFLRSVIDGIPWKTNEIAAMCRKEMNNGH